MRVVGIIGCGFSGSTLLSFMLGSLPGCKTVGEDWHLMEQEVECRCCPPGTCPVFVPGFRDGMEYRNAWEHLAGLLGTETLVVSDKIPHVYARYLEDNPVDISFVVLYKRPEAYVWSSMRHNRADSKISGLQYWTSGNAEALRFCRDGGYKYTVCSFEDLTEAPRKELLKISEALDLPYDPGAVEYWNHEHHDFGGNWSAHLNIWGPDEPRSKRYMDRPRKGWEHYRNRFRQIIPARDVTLPFTQEEIDAIYGFPGTLDTWEALRKEGGKE